MTTSRTLPVRRPIRRSTCAPGTGTPATFSASRIRLSGPTHHGRVRPSFFFSGFMMRPPRDDRRPFQRWSIPGALSAIPCPRHTPTRRQDRRCEGQRAAIDWLIFTMPLCTRVSPEGIPMTDHDDTLAYYATHSPFSDPGSQSPMLDNLLADIAVLRDAVTPLVFHYMGDGDWAENGIAPERRPEIDLRYAERMF